MGRLRRRRNARPSAHVPPPVDGSWTRLENLFEVPPEERLAQADALWVEASNESMYTAGIALLSMRRLFFVDHSTHPRMVRALLLRDVAEYARPAHRPYAMRFRIAGTRIWTDILDLEVPGQDERSRANAKAFWLLFYGQVDRSS